jgi:hypothetical protein
VLAILTVLPAAAAAQKTAAPKQSASAQAKAMPHNATARCGDDTWSTAASQKGACSQHGGVAKWFGKAPRGTTGRCNDGEYWTNAETQGACSSHGGVAYWSKKAKKSAKKAS